MILIKTWQKITQITSRYLMGPYDAGPKSALFLRVAIIKAGVRGADVIRAILESEYHLFEKLSFFQILVYCILRVCILSF